MKKAIVLSCLTVFLAAIPADAQILRRPVVRRFLASPVVHDVFNLAVAHYLPGLPAGALDNILSKAGAAGEPAKIYVDRSVQRNLEAIEENLDAAQSTIEELLKKNNLQNQSKKTSSQNKTLKFKTGI